MKLNSIKINNINSISNNKNSFDSYNVDKKINNKEVESYTVDNELNINTLEYFPENLIYNENGSVSVQILSDNCIHKYTPYNQGAGLGLSAQYSKNNMLNIQQIQQIKTKIVNKCKSFLTDEDINNKLIPCLNDPEFLKGIDKISVNNGCGEYALLTVLNGYYNMNISPIDFFTVYLIKAYGIDEWINIVNNKKALNINGIASIMKNNDFNYDLIAGYDRSDFVENKNMLSYQLQNNLLNGRPAIVTLSNGGKKDFEDWLDNATNTFLNIDKNKASEWLKEYGKDDNLDNTWTNYRHYVCLLGINSFGDVYIADSRNLGEDYSHIRVVNYNDLLDYLSDSNIINSNNESNTWGEDNIRGGIILCDPIKGKQTY